jgi:hypothetical protein
MNTKLALLTIPFLALLAPSGALAQVKNEGNPPPAADSGRQAIINKLEHIRLDTVSYDGLPLGEVVNMLREEARKRDPEKKGINFLINPNPDAAEVPATVAPQIGPDGNPLPASPSEQVDVNGIAIRIRPPLTDVRLVDVLDAVVKVADHPIQYTVEDYGVVFSQRRSEPARKEEIGLAFPGGTPSQFIGAVQNQYQVDWLSVADIPKEMGDVRIPRLRLSQNYSAATGLSREQFVNASLNQLVTLYNQLGEQRPELGRLIVKGDMTKPSVVMFVPDKTAMGAQPKVKVKAFSIYGMNDAGKVRLEQDIGLAKEEAMKYASRLRGASGPRSLEGTVAIHNDTSLLVATGTDSFVDMVESIVTAWEQKDRPRNPVAPTALPNAPEK